MIKKISMLCWLQFLHNTFHSFQEINVTCKITWNKDSIILLLYHHISAGKYTHKLHSNLYLNSRNRCNYSVINDLITDGTYLILRNFKIIICNATRTMSNSFQRWHSICWTYSLFLTLYPTCKRTLQRWFYITEKTSGYFFLTVLISQYTEAYTNSHWLTLLDGSGAVHLKHKITQTCIM
jgi:hypothetical protein